MTARRWAELNRDELRELTPGAVTIIPIASIEQHGPHLPTITDTALVEAVVEQACELIGTDVNVLVAPVVAYGASKHHLPFGATLSLTDQTVRLLLLDIIRSAHVCGARRVLIVNGHGGNATVCDLVAAEAAAAERIRIAATSYWDLIEIPPEDILSPGHAGAFETSMMLAVRPDLVRLAKARPSPGTLPRRLPGMRVEDPTVWEHLDGFTDDPRQSSAENGTKLLEMCARGLAAAITEFAAL